MVGDWGSERLYQQANVSGLRHLLAALAKTGGARRFIHISSLSAYPVRDHFGTDETEPVAVNNIEPYGSTKAEAELVLRRHAEATGLPFVILRPGFIYGPGDRHAVPRLVLRMLRGSVRLIGDGRKLHDNTYVGNLVDAIWRAMRSDAALGEAFNVRDGCLVTREEIVHTISDYLGQPRLRRVPEWLARGTVGLVEGFARVCRFRDPPILTRRQLCWMTQNLDFSIAKARRVLGYKPPVDFQEGIRQALLWLVDSDQEPACFVGAARELLPSACREAKASTHGSRIARVRDLPR